MEMLATIALAGVAVVLVGWLLSGRSDSSDIVVMNDPAYWRGKDIKDLEQALAITPQTGHADEDMSVFDAISQALAFHRRTLDNAVTEQRLQAYIAAAPALDHDTTLVLKDQ